MKRTAIAIIVVAALAGCSTTKNNGMDANVRDTRLATDFKREGIKVSYTWGGDVEKIEAYGYAPVWRGEYRIAAEADAKDKMVKFLRGESIDSNRMTRVIAKSMEKSQDNSSKNVQEGKITITEAEAEGNTGSVNSQVRDAAVENAHIVTQTITVSAQGRLNGVYKERGFVREDGKTYVAVYAWTPKMQDAARLISTQMDKR